MWITSRAHCKCFNPCCQILPISSMCIASATNPCGASAQPPAHPVFGMAPPPTPPVVVSVYHYYMNGKHTRFLNLKEPHQQCSWHSVETGLRTAWHGEWFRCRNNALVTLFDYKGRNDQRKHAVIYSDGGGSDYKGRVIQFEFGGRWQFNNEAAQYVCMS